MKHVLAAMAVLAIGCFAGAEPPRVVGAVPDHADIGVDPGVTEIRITFDQDMRAGTHSVCGGGPTFPPKAGEVTWADARTVVIPVKLEADHRYDLSVNCAASSKGFVNGAGEPAAAYPISFMTGKADGATGPLKAEERTAAIGALREAIDRRYSYRDLRGVDWDAAFREFGPRLEGATTESQFARAAADLLGKTNDLHVSVQVGPFRLAGGKRSVAPNLNVQTLTKLVPKIKQHAKAALTGRFEDGIGYILIGTWGPDRPADLDAVYVALAEMKDAPGVVVDVRANSGGDETLARQFAGCFVTEKQTYATHAMREPDSPGGFGEVKARTVEPNKDGPMYRGRVAVLVGPANMSSCESFIQMMKCVPGSRTFGERTFGSSGNPKPHKLLPDVTVYLPSWKNMSADGTPLEGRGLEPDQEVRATAEQLKDKDPVLEAALAWLRAPAPPAGSALPAVKP